MTDEDDLHDPAARDDDFDRDVLFAFGWGVLLGVGAAFLVSEIIKRL